MSENYANLTVVARNAEPIREEHYPHTWMVQSGMKAIRVHVAHDHALRPYVEAKFAA